MSKINVMVIDDDYYVREALEMLLRRNPKTTISSINSTPAEAIEVLKKAKKADLPDVILLDVRFENTDERGIDSIEGIREVMPDAKVLVSSMSNDEDLILEAISKGADGYVWKNESGDGLVSAIDMINQGRFVITKSIAEKIIGKAVELRDYSVEIMPEEKDFHQLTEELRKTVYLYCFCGMSAKEISDELCLSLHTVNSRIKTAYQVLQVKNRTEAFERLAERWE